MEVSKNNLGSRIANLFLSMFVPGRFASRLALSVCLGITTLGIFNIAFFEIVNFNLGHHVQVKYSTLRISLWMASNCYLIATVLIKKGFYSRILTVEKSNGSESAAKVSVKRAA